MSSAVRQTESVAAPPGEAKAGGAAPVGCPADIVGGPRGESAVIREFYRDPEVRRRIQEFLGGRKPTCRYITADDDTASRRIPEPVEHLDRALRRGFEIGRSLWDREALIADLDIEYVNFDLAAEAYLRPDDAFRKQAPVAAAAQRVLDRAGVPFLHSLSGRGHHLAWCVPFDSAAFRSLEEIGLEVALASERRPEPSPVGGARVSRNVRDAFLGLGLVMEYLACEVRRLAAPACEVPVELTAVEAGPSERGREVVSIDVSEYGDPLSSRAMRVPFSVYLKPRQLGLLAPGDLPPIVSVPLGELSLAAGLRTMRDPELARRWARRTSAVIPPTARGMARLIKEYLGSPLRGFHRWFYSHRQHPSREWPETYDHLPTEELPTCARHVLARPNDALLKPSGMRLVTRVLLALGWHPRHIAGLIRSKFERDHDWGTQWQGYDPAMRADLYTRVFSGPFFTRTDDLIDFNCQSSKEQRTCPAAVCSWNLERFRESALARRRYEYLARRPFNRLFLPTEHL